MDCQGGDNSIMDKQGLKNSPPNQSLKKTRVVLEPAHGCIFPTLLARQSEVIYVVVLKTIIISPIQLNPR